VKLKFFANRETFGWVADSFFMNCVLVAAVWVGVVAAAIGCTALFFWLAQKLY